MGSGVGDTELKRVAKLRACRNQVGLPHRSNHSWPSNGCSCRASRGHECHRNRMSPAVTDLIIYAPASAGPVAGRMSTCHTGAVRHALRQALETLGSKNPEPNRGIGFGGEWGGPVPSMMEG